MSLPGAYLECQLVWRLAHAPSHLQVAQGIPEGVLGYVKYPRAVDSLRTNRENLMSFYDFPAQHWRHIRSTNVIESTFATVRLRTKRTKGCGSRIATLTMVFKLIESAQKRWLRLHGYQKIESILQGIQFADGLAIAA